MSDAPNEIVTRAIDAVCAGDHLTADHAAAVLAEIMEGRTSEVQTAAFLIALRAKGETVPELVGLARTMRALAQQIDDLPAARRGQCREGAVEPCGAHANFLNLNPLASSISFRDISLTGCAKVQWWPSGSIAV